MVMRRDVRCGMMTLNWERKSHDESEVSERFRVDTLCDLPGRDSLR